MYSRFTACGNAVLLAQSHTSKFSSLICTHHAGLPSWDLPCADSTTFLLSRLVFYSHNDIPSCSCASSRARLTFELALTPYSLRIFSQTFQTIHTFFYLAFFMSNTLLSRSIMYSVDIWFIHNLIWQQTANLIQSIIVCLTICQHFEINNKLHFHNVYLS